MSFDAAPAGWVANVTCTDRSNPAGRECFTAPVIGWALVEHGGPYVQVPPRSIEPVFLTSLGAMNLAEYRRLFDAERIECALEQVAA